jgi:hypothetical protein
MAPSLSLTPIGKTMRSALTTPRHRGPVSELCYHPAPSLTENAAVQPVRVRQLANEILTAIPFLPFWLLTDTKVAHVGSCFSPLIAALWGNGHTSRTTSTRRTPRPLGQLDCLLKRVAYHVLFRIKNEFISCRGGCAATRCLKHV